MRGRLDDTRTCNSRNHAVSIWSKVSKVTVGHGGWLAELSCFFRSRIASGGTACRARGSHIVDRSINDRALVLLLRTKVERQRDNLRIFEEHDPFLCPHSHPLSTTTDCQAGSRSATFAAATVPARP